MVLKRQHINAFFYESDVCVVNTFMSQKKRKNVVTHFRDGSGQTVAGTGSSAAGTGGDGFHSH